MFSLFKKFVKYLGYYIKERRSLKTQKTFHGDESKRVATLDTYQIRRSAVGAEEQPEAFYYQLQNMNRTVLMRCQPVKKKLKIYKCKSYVITETAKTM
jgi:hypothetical protein